jgi:pimeloyl-ACP methyl ester carboxylesterase
VPEIRTDDATLHVEVDGRGDPVTVFAHGLTNSCMELAALTPLAPGTKVRFCFRGHGHSSAPDADAFGYGDLARDVAAVADAYGATCAFGTSMGAGAVTRLLATRPDRFERIVFLLPAALDLHMRDRSGFEARADLLETLDADEALERALADADRAGAYDAQPWLRGVAMLMWQDQTPSALARAIRGVVRDVPVADRDVLRTVEAPVLLICQRGDALHPIEVGHALADVLPNAELLEFGSTDELFAAIPSLVERVGAFLRGAA